MSPHSRKKLLLRRGVGILATIAAVGALSFTGVSSASASDRISFASSVPSWAKTANDAGAAPADETFEGELYLPLRNAAEAAALATAVSTPGAKGYRQFLTPAQWIARYSPLPSDIADAVAYLKSYGLTITAVPASRQYIVYRGTDAQLSAAFSTTLRQYNYAGHTLVGPSTPPSVPASFAGKISGVSVDQSKTLTRPTIINRDKSDSAGVQTFAKKAAAATVPAVPCSNYSGQYIVTEPLAYGTTKFETGICGYVPSQLRSAYGTAALLKSGLNGAGQTVGIVDAYASPTIVSDTNTYSAQVGEPALTTYSQVVSKVKDYSDVDACGTTGGWQGEQTLDVQAVHAIAPAAKIIYSGGFNCGGGIDIALSRIIDGKLATIVSNSYGYIGEALSLDAIQGEVNIQLQAAAEGIGLYFSSGDNGDEVASLGYASPDFAASSPWVTSVGGTSLGINKAGAISYETGWGSTRQAIVVDAYGKPKYAGPLPGDFVFGAGGGTSAVFDQPDYQKGIVPFSLAKGNRVSPDISALADPYTGFSTGVSPIVDDATQATAPFERETVGGTSLASPLAAAQIALVQQASHTTIGFANPTLYALYRVAPSAYRDVLPLTPTKALVYTSPSTGITRLITLGADTTLKTTAKYDDVTGLGSVSFQLLSQLAAGRH